MGGWGGQEAGGGEESVEAADSVHDGYNVGEAEVAVDPFAQEKPVRTRGSEGGKMGERDAPDERKVAVVVRVLLELLLLAFELGDDFILLGFGSLAGRHVCWRG